MIVIIQRSLVRLSVMLKDSLISINLKFWFLFFSFFLGQSDYSTHGKKNKLLSSNTTIVVFFNENFNGNVKYAGL